MQKKSERDGGGGESAAYHILVPGKALAAKVEKEKMKHKCQRIMDHGIGCFINRQLIYNYPEELFAQGSVPPD